MIKAMIFDMDGTLVDSEHLHFKAWNDTLEQYGAPHTSFERYLDYVGTSNENFAVDHIDAHDLGVSCAHIVKEKQQHYLNLLGELTPLEGVVDLINEMSESYRLAIGSSSDFIELEKILSILALRQFFEVVVGGDMVEQKKPDPGVYLKALSLLNLKPAECVAFEDSESGVAAAHEAGLYVIAVPSKLSLHHDFHKADRLLTSLADVDHALLTSLTR